MNRRLCAVVGGSSCSREEYAAAREVGRLLAREGFAVVTGGLGGVMEAASRGAREEGGLVLGLLPGTDAADANPFVEIALPTGLGDARNALVAAAGDAVVAVGGSLGTLSEVALALKRGTPVAGLGTWSLDPERIPPGGGILEASSPEEAVRLLLAALAARPGPPGRRG
ncbi:MAG: TIGR00725 family protein [Planctomycetes bacterium]|nr:TIGR00725 family protein [Planctomycetota bacterium]